jgi:hypothetical protein
MDRLQIIASIEGEIKQLQQARALLAGGEGSRATLGQRGPRHMSADARARIAAAQRVRWAKVKAGQKNVVSPDSQPEKKRTRRMSAAGRARIAAAQKARWAKLRSKKK